MKKIFIIVVFCLILLYGCSAKDNKNDINIENTENNNAVAVWEDKNFEALIRSYLGNFDKDIYLKDLDDITELEIHSYVGVTTNIKSHAIPQEDWDKIGLLTSMKDIDNFNNLKKITLWSNDIETMHVYKNSSNIEYLELGSNNITDISNIIKYNNLTHFGIYDNYIADLKPLENLTMLKELDIVNIGQRADNIFGCIESELDIDDIDDLKNLEFLHIENSNISNISKLNNLNNLTILHFYWCSVNADDLCFSNCYKLEALSLHIFSPSGEQMVLDITKFDNLINLKSFGISDVLINENESFSKLANLESISFSNVKFENIEILESLSNLERISFNYTDIESLKHLKNNTKLKSISVTYGNLSDISDLKLFPNVETLILPDNNITDISILTQLNNLKKVIVINNPILDTSVIDELKKREGIIIN